MEPIKIWPFYDAPDEYAQHFDNDDADWLALIPKNYTEEYIGFLDDNTPFGICYIEIYVLPNGDYLKVGYHA